MKKILFLITISVSLFFVQNSRAAIVYSNPADVTVNTTTSAAVDFNNDGTSEFTLSWMGGAVGTTTNPPSLDFVTWSSSTDWDVFKNIAYNTAINSSSGFYTQGDCYFNPGWEASGHSLATNTDLYIGVKFKISASTYYGWVKVNIATGTGYVTVKEYAYESVAGTGINAGAISSVDIANTANQEISLFMCNAQNQLMISSPDKICNIEIYDMNGAIVFSKLLNVENYTVDMSSLRSGNYVAVIKSMTGINKRKVFKN